MENVWSVDHDCAVNIWLIGMAEIHPSHNVYVSAGTWLASLCISGVSLKWNGDLGGCDVYSTVKCSVFFLSPYWGPLRWSLPY